MNIREKEMVLNTVKATVELMNNNYSFIKYMEILGLESKDYKDLYKAGGMYLVDISSILDELSV